jgi:hypothetical protein
MFIEKSTGKIFETCSGRSIADYVKAYRATGNFYANLSQKAIITGITKPEHKEKSYHHHHLSPHHHLSSTEDKYSKSFIRLKSEVKPCLYITWASSAVWVSTIKQYQLVKKSLSTRK